MSTKAVSVALAAALLTTGTGLVASCEAQAQAQKRIYQHLGPTAGQRFGMAVAGVGDMDKDGFDDYAIEEFNAVAVYSGRTGTVMRKFAMTGVDWVYPAMAGGGDVNNDGVPDLIVGDWNSSAQQRGTVWVVSGRWVAQGVPPQMIHTIDADPLQLWLLGATVDDGGDLDGDGYDDILTSAQDNGQSAWYAIAFSGRTGRELWRQANGLEVRAAGDVNRDGKDDAIAYNGSTAWVYSGPDGQVLRTLAAGASLRSVDGLGDVNQDGYADVILGVRSVQTVEVRSGKDGSLIHRIGGYASGFGRDVRGVGDMDGDKVPDLIVSHTFSSGGPVRAFSGATGSLIDDFGFTPGNLKWWAIDGAGDVNGDGIDDVILGLYLENPDGIASVFSGKPLALVTDQSELSRTAGGTQSFTLDAGTSHAGKLYLLVGSLSGVRPGTPVAPNVTVPLNNDGYTKLTVDSPNSWIAGSLGRLDSAGRAGASLKIPPGLFPVAVQADHAFVVCSSAGRIEFASNAVPLTVQ